MTGGRAQGTPTVFINEIHYDNSGTDVNEFIEIAGPAGTNLAEYSIVLYNGSGGAVYDTGRPRRNNSESAKRIWNRQPVLPLEWHPERVA